MTEYGFPVVGVRHQVRQLRNLLHPTRYLEDHYRKRITSKHAQLVFDTMDAINQFLGGRVEDSLSESMAAEGEDI